MKPSSRPITVVVAEDDPDDRVLIGEALLATRLSGDVRFVVDGEELMDYLRHRGSYARRGASPRPSLILLDLNMPRKNGSEALAEIKSDPALRQVPVVVLTTSEAEEDVFQSYDLGANSFITKPASFGSLVAVMKTLELYWLDAAAIPGAGRPAGGGPG
jgi:two-component system, response regulator